MAHTQAFTKTEIDAYMKTAVPEIIDNCMEWAADGDLGSVHFTWFVIGMNAMRAKLSEMLTEIPVEPREVNKDAAENV